MHLECFVSNNRVTRATDGYKFDLKIPHSGIYPKSPYYVGANSWNNLLPNIQNMTSKAQFKKELRARNR